MPSLTHEKAFDRVNRYILWNITNTRVILNIVWTSSEIYRSIVLSTGEDLIQEIYINQEVWQECSLSPTSFSIYIDVIVKEWKLRVNPGIKINNGTFLNAVLGTCLLYTSTY